LGRQVGVELEWHPADVDLEFARELLPGLVERGPANRAPRAHHVGPDVDGESRSNLGHGQFSSHHCSRWYAIAWGGGGMKLMLSRPLASASPTSARVNQRASSISALSIA